MNLIFVVNRIPLNFKFNSTIVINDSDIYKLIQEEGQNILGIINNIIDLSFGTKVVIHTFNPLILNYVSDELAIETFYYFDHTNNLVKFFEFNELAALSVLGPGEVVADSLKINI
jgi:hypothetical protein